MRSQNERHLLMFRLILMSIVLSFIPVIVIHSIIRPDTYSHYAIILVYTLMLMGIGYHMYIRYAERTARELKALVKKEATINGELVLINTEEKLKSIISLEIERVAQTGEKSAMLFFDVDDLGRFNENYGYDVGDQIIIELILATKKLISESDRLARIKGDTFAVLFPKSDANHVYNFALDLKKEIEAIKFDVRETVSCRFVILEIDRWITEDKFLNLAYEKLVLAKDYGKGVIL